MKSIYIFIISLLPITFSTTVLANTSPTVAQQYEGIEITVNINTGSVKEISTLLSGIGEAKAQQIIDYRDQHGPFETVEQLTEIKGIGPSIVERNRERILL